MHWICRCTKQQTPVFEVHLEASCHFHFLNNHMKIVAGRHPRSLALWNINTPIFCARGWIVQSNLHSTLELQLEPCSECVSYHPAHQKTFSLKRACASAHAGVAFERDVFPKQIRGQRVSTRVNTFRNSVVELCFYNFMHRS